MDAKNQPVVFRLEFKASEPLSEILEYVRKIKETHPDAIVCVKVGGV